MPRFLNIRMPWRALLAVMCLLTDISVSQSQTFGNWQLLGPSDFPVNNTGQIHGIGRVCQIKFHPSQDSILYAASASGGLFKSVNNGADWFVLGTDVLPKTACASVCIDHTNDSVLYLGTGDPNYYGNGAGIWKSTDAGVTWVQSSTGIGNLLAVELLMHPTDPLQIIAATKDGIWKTYDGGQNWVVKNPGGEYTDMVWKAVPGTSVLFAATKDEFWVSNDVGETWNMISFPLPSGGYASGIRVGVSPADTNVVYLGVLFYEPGNHYGTVYRSDDGGATFTGVKTQAAPDIAGYDATSPGQGNYNWTLCVNPLDADKVYVGSHCVWRSDDGGTNWTKLTNWWQEVHTDMHHFLFNPYNTQEFWQANDGGVWLSVDDGLGWDPVCDGLSATENYHAAQSPIRKGMISAGTQDNGETFYDGAGWFCNRGGDWGTRMIFDYVDPVRVYYYENGNRRSVYGSQQSLDLPFTASNNMRMAFTPLNTDAAYATLQGVWSTVDLNSNPPTWTQILSLSTNVKAVAVAIHRPDQVYAVESNSTIHRIDHALSASPVITSYGLPVGTTVSAHVTTVDSDTNVVYLASGSKVYRSDDRGATWTNVTYNLPNVNIIGLIHDSAFAGESLYAASAVGVWYKNDTMSYWINYSQGLPSIAGISDLMMYNNGSVSNSLRVSYYGRGTWVSEPFGAAALPPDPLFTADTLYGCTGLTVQFTDQSLGNPVTWNWNFPGGTPQTSSLQNPQVVYNSPGIYEVQLTVSNSNGIKTIVKPGYITVLGPSPLPLQEGFQAVQFPPQGWIQYSVTNDAQWERNSIVGGYGLTQGCAFFDNYNQDRSGKRYALRTPAYDLTMTDSALILMDVAYAQYSNFYSDTLIVSASTDCGQTWTTLYYKGGFELATSGNVTAAAFVPAQFQWRTDTIWLDGFAGFPQVQFAFENKNGYGQILYVDNINILQSVNTGISDIDEIPVKLYPNPSNGPVNLEFMLNDSRKITFRIYDAAGRLVKELPERLYESGGHQLVVDGSRFPAGTYRIEATSIGGYGSATFEKIR